VAPSVEPRRRRPPASFGVLRQNLATVQVAAGADR